VEDSPLEVEEEEVAVEPAPSEAQFFIINLKKGVII